MVINRVRTAHIHCEAMTHAYVTQMQDGCNAARSDAIKRIKEHTISYLASGRMPIKVDPQVKHKVLRGLTDHDIGRLLIPAEDLEDWDADRDAYIYRSR